jgi:hypothetical protein
MINSTAWIFRSTRCVYWEEYGHVDTFIYVATYLSYKCAGIGMIEDILWSHASALLPFWNCPFQPLSPESSHWPPKRLWPPSWPDSDGLAEFPCSAIHTVHFSLADLVTHYWPVSRSWHSFKLLFLGHLELLRHEWKKVKLSFFFFRDNCFTANYFFQNLEICSTGKVAHKTKMSKHKFFTIVS